MRARIIGTATRGECIVFYTIKPAHFLPHNLPTNSFNFHSLDRMDGLQGLIIIEDPDDPSEQALKEMYDEERVLFLQDWYHKSGSSLRNSKHDIYMYIL